MILFLHFFVAGQSPDRTDRLASSLVDGMKLVLLIGMLFTVPKYCHSVLYSWPFTFVLYRLKFLLSDCNPPPPLRPRPARAQQKTTKKETTIRSWLFFTKWAESSFKCAIEKLKLKKNMKAPNLYGLIYMVPHGTLFIDRSWLPVVELLDNNPESHDYE